MRSLPARGMEAPPRRAPSYQANVFDITAPFAEMPLNCHSERSEESAFAFCLNLRPLCHLLAQQLNRLLQRLPRLPKLSPQIPFFFQPRRHRPNIEILRLQ